MLFGVIKILFEFNIIIIIKLWIVYGIKFCIYYEIILKNNEKKNDVLLIIILIEVYGRFFLYLININFESWFVYLLIF